MSRIIPYEAKDVEGVVFRDDGSFSSLMFNSIKSMLSALANQGNGFTVLEGDKVIGVIGFYVMWDGVCELWSMPTEHTERYPLAYASTIRWYLNKIQNTFDMHRFQIVAADDALHNRWLEFLKFECEGVLRKFSDTKKDFKIWSRVK